MFIVCNYLDVCKKDDVRDGFVVEQCSVYDKSLESLVVVCREHRISNVLDWAKTNMGTKYPMFEKQFGINKTKAMCFIKAKGGIKSFTEELVISCGGLEAFKKMFMVEGPEVDFVEPESVEEAEPAVVETTTEPVTSATAMPKSVAEPSPVTVVEQPKVESSPVDAPVTSQIVTPIPVVEPEVRTFDTEYRNASFSGTDEFERRDEQKEEKVCHRDCIYNADGSFKGFTEGDILSLVAKLRDMNNRIALDDLDPDKVLTKSEFTQVATYLDTVSPSIIKAFILHELDNVTTETDRIRMSAILDKLSTFIMTLNKE